MGQQQLLLVILVTIIVGIATVVAINVFGSSAKNANRDAVRQDILTIGAQAQGWYMKPTMMGGGGNTFTGIDFNKIGFGYSSVVTGGSTPSVVRNANGKYDFKNVTKDSVEVEATPSQDSTNVIDAWISQGNIKFQ